MEEVRAWRYDIEGFCRAFGTVTSIEVKSKDVLVVVTDIIWSSVVRILERDAILKVAYDKSPPESSSACATFLLPLCGYVPISLGL